MRQNLLFGTLLEKNLKKWLTLSDRLPHHLKEETQLSLTVARVLTLLSVQFSLEENYKNTPPFQRRGRIIKQNYTPIKVIVIVVLNIISSSS